jgi:DNA integrity scanning protein DisA with diadenylate cyclase activity
MVGFRTVEEIQAAPDEELLRVEGVGKGLLRKLRESF